MKQIISKSNGPGISAIITLVFILVAGMPPLSLAEDKKQSAEDIAAMKVVNEGKALYNNGDFDGARARFNEALKIKHNYPSALAMLAETIAAEKTFSMTPDDYTRAYRLARKALLLDDDLVDGYRAMAQIERMRKNVLPSIKLATLAVNMDPKDPMNHFVLASTYLMATPAKSAEHFEKALELGSKDPRIPFNLGVLYLGLKRYEDAEKQTLEYLKLKPGDIRAFNNLGQIYSEMGELDKSIEHYRKVIDKRPDFFASLKGLGDVKMKQKKYEKAAGYYEKACNASPRDPLLFYLKGEALAKAGKVEDAKSAYKKAIELNPKFTPAIQKLKELDDQP